MNNNNTKIPKLILAAEPVEAVHIPNFFLIDNNKFYDILKEPPYLRYMGWNMLTLDTPRIKRAEYWEVTNGDRKIIRFYKDGSFVAMAHANQDFLGWGQKKEDFQQNPRLHSLAVIEFVTEFVEVYRRILNEMPSTKSVRFMMGVKNSQVGNKNMQLPTTKMSDIFYGSVAVGMGKLEEDFMVDHSVELKDRNQFDTRYVAFELLSIIFAHFEISSEKIPYTSIDNKGNRFVNVKEIKSVR